MAASPPSPGFGCKTLESLNILSRMVELLLQEEGCKRAGGTSTETVSDDKGLGSGSGSGKEVILVMSRLPVLITWRGKDSADFNIINDEGMRFTGIGVKEICVNLLTKIPNAEGCIPVIVGIESSEVHNELSEECSLLDLAYLSDLASEGLKSNFIRSRDTSKTETSSSKETSMWNNICSDVLQLILDALPLPASLNTRGVCTFWKSEVKAYLLHKPRKNAMPWILYDEVVRITSESRMIYDPIGKIFSELDLHIREVVGLCAVWNGWVALLDKNGVIDHLILFNPVNNSNTRVPIHTKVKITQPMVFFSSEPRNVQCVIMILGSIFWSIRGTYTCYPACINGRFYLNCGPRGGYTGGKRLIELDISDGAPRFRTIEMSYGEWWLDAPSRDSCLSTMEICRRLCRSQDFRTAFFTGLCPIGGVSAVSYE